jgi:hypothetical protein
VTNQKEVVEIEIRLEATLGGGEISSSLVQVQFHLANLTMQSQDISKEKVVRTYDV